MTIERMIVVQDELMQMGHPFSTDPKLGAIYLQDRAGEISTWRTRVSFIKSEVQADMQVLRLKHRAALGVKNAVGVLDEKQITDEIPTLEADLIEHGHMLQMLDSKTTALNALMGDVRAAIALIAPDDRHASFKPSFLDERLDRRSTTKDPLKDATLEQAEEFIRSPMVERS